MVTQHPCRGHQETWVSCSVRSEEIIGKANIHFVMKPNIFLLDGITGFFVAIMKRQHLSEILREVQLLIELLI